MNEAIDHLCRLIKEGVPRDDYGTCWYCGLYPKDGHERDCPWEQARLFLMACDEKVAV